jgi:hypothetical protein
METLKLDDKRMDWVTGKTNRHPRQTQSLFELVDGDFGRLLQLESLIKRHFLSYSPGDKEEVERILSLPEPRTDWKGAQEWMVKWDLCSEWESERVSVMGV